MADVYSLTESERKDGILGSCSYVQYDKGDKYGNRWHIESPYLIDWSVDKVSCLKTDTRARFQNSKFYFREGFCYSDIKTFFIRCRLKGRSIHDVKSMSLFPIVNKLPYYYLISIINSELIAQIVNSFMNNTPSFQINDCRTLPIPVPSEHILKECKRQFDYAVTIQKNYFSGIIDVNERDCKLNFVQSKIDIMIYALYNLTKDEISAIK